MPVVVVSALLLAVLVGLALWPPWRLPVVVVNASQDTWTLPPLATALDVDRAAVAAARVWARAGSGLPSLPAQEPPLTPPDWRIAGVYANGAQSAIIVSVQGQPDQTLGVGALLPGGARIAAIAPERICIVLNGKRLSLSIHRE